MKTGLIESRRIIFTPDVDLKDELKNTAIQITCIDHIGDPDCTGRHVLYGILVKKDPNCMAVWIFFVTLPAFVFFMRDEMSARLQNSLLGFASGVMIAASVWSLLIPAMEMETESGKWAVMPAAVGFLAGMGFLLLIDELTPHLHIGTDKPEGMRSHLSKTAMLALAVTIHNLPEGMAVGVVFAGAENGVEDMSMASALAIAVGIAIQNIPEGAIISMPMRAAGNSRWRSFVLGSLSGAVEPVGALAVLLLASMLTSILPYMLAFAAGAMCYVVVEELIPEASSGKHSNLSTIGFAIGFVLMMVLDVVLG